MDSVAAHGAHQQRVAIGRGLSHEFRADLAARAGLVLHDHALSQIVAKVLRIDARGGVGRAAGRKRHNHAHGFRGPGVGRGRAGRQRQDRAREGNTPQLFHGSLLWVDGAGMRGRGPRPRAIAVAAVIL
ncbi:hypothetical protein D9M68_652070 [compost metagenome]